MNWRAAAFGSLAANVVLAAALVGLFGGPAAKSRSNRPSVGTGSDSSSSSTNVLIRRQPFSWREIESPDYPTYIANLRFIGCPEQTIRDIIIADVNAMFARRRSTDLVTTEQQWWRSEPDPELAQAATEKATQLERERRELLTNLLGVSWESGDMLSLPRPTRPGIVLDGPVLGSLPAETKQAVQDINARSQERMEAYLQGRLSEGKNVDPAEVVRMRLQTRDELARVLAPVQLEEYLLRYSQNATELRSELGTLRHFGASPDEFRAMFRATDALDQRIQTITGSDPNSQQARRALEDERENAIRIALGPRRYEEYRNLQDPLYRDAMDKAIAAGTPEAARVIYQANLAAAQEQASITLNTNLTEAQRNVALKQLELEHLTANTLATGQEPVATVPPPLPPPLARRSYVIRPGDSPAVIALIYGVPVSALRQANPNVNFRRLRPGDQIFLPPAMQPPVGAP